MHLMPPPRRLLPRTPRPSPHPITALPQSQSQATICPARPACSSPFRVPLLYKRRVCTVHGGGGWGPQEASCLMKSPEHYICSHWVANGSYK